MPDISNYDTINDYPNIVFDILNLAIYIFMQ